MLNIINLSRSSIHAKFVKISAIKILGSDNTYVDYTNNASIAQKSRIHSNL